MAYGSQLAGLFTGNPVQKVSATGQPLIGGSESANLLARSLGGLFGVDLRTPEEKIVAATAGIDRTTAAGQLEAIETRLKFETDPDKRNALGQQAVQLRRQMTSDAAKVKTTSDLADLNARAEPILREAGYEELADMAKAGSLTQAQITSNLGSIRKDKIILERNRGDLAQAILNTPELEGTEAFKLAQQGKLPDIAPRFQMPYLKDLREEAAEGNFLKIVKARKGGERIATDLEEGVITFTEAQKQAADLGNVSYGDVKFYKVDDQILPTRERKQQDGTKDVVTWSDTLGKYVLIDETRLEKVPTDREPRVVPEPSKSEKKLVLNQLTEYSENTEPQQGQEFSNKDKYSALDDDTQKRVLVLIGDRAEKLKAQNPGTTFSENLQQAIEETLSGVTYKEGGWFSFDSAEFTPPVISDWSTGGTLK
jgi:hypothetical protein